MTVEGFQTADLEVAVAEVVRLPPDHPDRARRAADLISVLIRQPASSIHLFRHMGELQAAAERDPPQTVQWPRTRRAALAMSLVYAITYDASVGLDSIEAELGRLAAESVGDPEIAALVESARMGLMVRRAIQQGDESVLHRLPQVVAGLGSSVPGNPTVARLREIARLGAEALAANQRGDSASAWRQFDLMQRAIGNLPPEDPVRESMNRASAPAEAFRTLFDKDGSPREGRLTEEQLKAFASLADPPGAHPVLSGLAAGVAFLGLGDETDLARVDQGVASFRQTLAQTPPGDPQRAFCLQSLAMALYRRSELTGRTDGLDEACALLEEARGLLGGPQHPQWSLTNEILSVIRQRTGDHAGVPESGLAAQRGYAWRVLLETDPAGAQISVRNAAQDALDNARRCITVGDPAGALRALDAGRGLMLFAAMELHRIPARLEAAGRPDLARQWSREGTRSDRLRRKVLDVLTKQSTDSLFDPPTLSEVQSALALLDADALIYLVPGDPPHGGLAVMAPAVGPPAFMALQHLYLAGRTDVARYLIALSTRDAVDQNRDVAPEDGNGFADRVEALCHWAWRAAIGPLLESYVPRLPARPDRSVPRIVLIPMGDLARVPWPAARRRDGTYAVQLAAITHAASARLLCDNAALAPVPLGPTGLVVGDPDTGRRADPLVSARMEAYAVRRAFYRGARYVGRLPDGRSSPSGAGTAIEVRAWLANRSPSAGAMLHLACHGFFASGPGAGARLLLADVGSASDEDRRTSELSVEELVDLMAEVPDRAIALVVLAACNSGRSVYGYDEAYSLGTGFLAGGARSVLSTQWSVPDAATSSLMFLFHHYARHDGLPPWQALRQAQMWMLDPDRKAPHGMPPELVPGPTDDPTGVLAWAGFVHYGQ